jgi:hypothetical protein
MDGWGASFKVPLLRLRGASGDAGLGLEVLIWPCCDC